MADTQPIHIQQAGSDYAVLEIRSFKHGLRVSVFLRNGLGSGKMQLAADVIPAKAGIQQPDFGFPLRGNDRFGNLFLDEPSAR
jgi:hypothetical protein